MNMLKTIATAIFCFIAAAEEQPSEATQPKAARGTVAVAPLPAAEYADTEVSTNIPFAVSFDAMSRVDFSLSMDASPTNGVEVAIGEDADGDGNLSLDEADFTVRGDGHHPGWLFVMFDLLSW